MLWVVLALFLQVTPASGQDAPVLLEDAVARLQRNVDARETTLAFDETFGYLPSVLKALDIDPSSQSLVFTKTSFQIGRISPETPRAVYFTDDAYVAWLQDGESLEISSVDPNLGAVFYTLPQEELAQPRFERQAYLCHRCHDSYSVTGDGVPRHFMGSAVPDESGRPAFHEGWTFTDDTTPLEKRWGGWYVTGTHGDQRHLGNMFVEDPAAVTSLDRDKGANVTDLGELIDDGPYLVKHSDIVALMVLEHQVHVQNSMTEVHYVTRREKAEAGELDVESVAEPLVRALLFADETPLTDEIRGTSGYAADFEQRGPFDSKGRSLRQFDLETRLFAYPLSYLIYSASFDALPTEVRRVVYRRLQELLQSPEPDAVVERLSRQRRADVLEILEATKPDFAALRQSGETLHETPRPSR